MLKAEGAKVDRMKTTKDKLLASNPSQYSGSDRTANIDEQLSTYKGATPVRHKYSYSRPMSRNDMPFLVNPKESGLVKQKRNTIVKNSRMQIQSPYQGHNFDRYDGYDNDND